MRIGSSGAAINSSTTAVPTSSESHLYRGDEEVLKSQLREAKEFVEEGGCDHRFKRLFGKSAASTEDIEALVSFLKSQLD